MQEICKPTVNQALAIKVLIDVSARQGALLPRAAIEIYENIRDFHILMDEQGVAGCCALHIDMANLAEIRSLVVREGLRGQGMGSRLVQACLEEARQLDIARTYALTRVPEFFRKHGFVEIDKHELPNKVFRDCIRCPLFPDCDEIAVIRDL